MQNSFRTAVAASFLIVSPGALCAQQAEPSPAQQAQSPAFVPGELIIGYASEGDVTEASNFFAGSNEIMTLAGGETLRSSGAERVGSKAIKVRVSLPQNLAARAKADPKAELEILLEAAAAVKKKDSRIRYAEPNWLNKIDPQPKVPLDPSSVRKLDKKGQSSVPNDMFYASGSMWQLGDGAGGINATTAWKTTMGSSDVVVAVVDTGLDLKNADMAKSVNVLPGTSFVSGEDKRDAGDVDTHGTHVAGTIGASTTNNERMIAGVAWTVKVLPVRVFPRGGNASTSGVAEGILWAAGKSVGGAPNNPTPAHVINLSLGYQGPCAGLMQDAVNDALAAGAVIVAAAGNSAMDVAEFAPANCTGVISVAAGDHRGKLTPYSNFGNVSVMAPGGDLRQKLDNGTVAGIWSTVATNCELQSGDARTLCERYGVVPYQGTSMAAPHVSGALALALAHHPEWRGKPQLVAQMLKASLRPLDADACAGKACGPGYLDAARLVNAKAEAEPPANAEGKSPEIAKSKPDSPSMATPAAAEEKKPGIDGKWIGDDGDGPFEISGEVWRHPGKGKGDIEGSGEERKIHYVSHQGVVCSYRMRLIANGEKLVLTLTDATLPRDYCPSGILNRVVE